MYPKIEEYITGLENWIIPQTRRQLLQPLIDYIRMKRIEEKPIRINFICTHNSRRSHLAQVWLQTLAHYYGLNEVYCYSGGTETTAVYPVIIATLGKVGFQAHLLVDNDNRMYGIKFANDQYPVILFSKRYDHYLNPSTEFCAVMTCSQADEECPIISGAEHRSFIPYEDPKIFDGTPDQEDKYRERCAQIAAEMAYVIRESRVS